MRKYVLIFVFSSVIVKLKGMKHETMEKKRKVTYLFKQRIADDQFKVESEKNAIGRLVQNNYKSEYSHILTRMLRYCNSVKMKEESEKVEPINVPEDVLEMNIIPFFEGKGLKFENIEIKPMAKETEDLYSKQFPI